jgi:hypothetical protein
MTCSISPGATMTTFDQSHCAGWTFDDSEAWLTESLTQLLLEPSP